MPGGRFTAVGGAVAGGASSVPADGVTIMVRTARTMFFFMADNLPGARIDAHRPVDHIAVGGG
ncbi:hypothetical protein Acy02nite_56610 [Actinoplanes cyaneus]|uniref:Uncharacterized protein n=1 Tax=Actinoplanes cyaneus TaxID=52696 RepID=A0A919ITJ5_9ACTN|nr:hypothetical protein Acy02nite_56610 [Actinoplanes cyaneus]